MQDSYCWLTAVLKKEFKRDVKVWRELVFGKQLQIIKMGEKPYREEEEKEFDESSSISVKFFKAFSVSFAILSILSIAAYYSDVLSYNFVSRDTESAKPPFSFKKYIDLNANVLNKIEQELGFDVNRLDASNEGIEVGYPYIPSPSYGEAVYSTLLVNHTFGNSWNSPASASFEVPKGLKFNKVVLTLNTSVDYVQYDRLAHIFINGAEVWRTSTIEPSGRLRFSTFKKDISPYALLFDGDVSVLFSLSNIVTDSLKGEFDTQLYADFYYSDIPALTGDEDSGVEDVLNLGILSTSDTPSKIIPLVPKSSSRAIPVLSLPDDTFEITLPKFPVNTTRLRLSIFASGNGNEEFWYTNLLDKYKDLFGGSWLTHGPIRFINVYFNGQKILSQTPHPVIFTGGIAPTLWNPVSNNAFDLKSNDLDISGLLPYLWESSSSNNTLQISISNGIDEFNGGDSGIGSNWYTSANILSYENLQVEKSTGEIIHIGQRDRGNSIGVNVPYSGTYQQIVNGILSAELTSQLNFSLITGEELNTLFSYHTKGEVANVQNYASSGSIQNIVHVGHSVKSLLITNVDNLDTILKFNASLSYPLTLGTTTVEESDRTILDVKIVNVKEVQVDEKDIKIFEAAVGQNGSAHFIMTNSGNSGTGKLHVDYRLKSILGDLNYRRIADGVNLQIVSDVEQYGQLEDIQSIDELDLKDPGSGQDTNDFIRASFPDDTLIDPVLDEIIASGIENQLNSSNEMKRSKILKNNLHLAREINQNQPIQY